MAILPEAGLTGALAAPANIRFLGAPRAVGGHGTCLQGPRRLAVLAYLVLARPRGMHTRDALIAMFWPDASTSSGRHALRNVLHAIRGALGPEVLITLGDTLVGVALETIDCDVLSIERQLADSELEKAVDAADADVLAGFHISGAPQFERWLDGERVRLRGQLIAAARACVQQRSASGDLAGAIAFARKAMALSPEDESILRLLLDLMGEAGESATALRAYDEFAAMLRDEYDAEPDQSTKSLAARLRSARPSQAVDDSIARDLYERGTYLFLRAAPIGHVADLQKSHDLFQQALARQPGFALALAGLSNYFAVAGARNILRPFHVAFGQTIDLSQRALALDHTLAIPHVHFGVKALYLDCDWHEGGRQFARAAELDPGYAEARRFLGIFLEGIGQSDLALAEHRAAVRSEPHIALFRNSLAAALMAIGAIDDAVEELQYALALDAKYSAARERLVRCYERQDRFDLAAAERKKDAASATADAFAAAFACEGPAGYRRLREVELRELIATLSVRALAGSTDNAADLFTPLQLRLAVACAELGDWEQVAQWERHACLARPGLRQWFVSHPDLARFR